MAFEKNMIYLPNSNYNFRDTKGGGTVAQLKPNYFLANKKGMLEPKIELNKLCEIFQKAKNNYWDDTKCKGYCFAFIREDGAEFAIRILDNTFQDVLGYWRDLTYPKSIRHHIEIFDHEIKEYQNFLGWLEEEVQN